MGWTSGDALPIPAPETRLSRWHPYPAMIPMIWLPSLRPCMFARKPVLDPFCGSGRLLMAAAAKAQLFRA